MYVCARYDDDDDDDASRVNRRILAFGARRKYTLLIGETICARMLLASRARAICGGWLLCSARINTINYDGVYRVRLSVCVFLGSTMCERAGRK